MDQKTFDTFFAGTQFEGDNLKLEDYSIEGDLFKFRILASKAVIAMQNLTEDSLTGEKIKAYEKVRHFVLEQRLDSDTRESVEATFQDADRSLEKNGNVWRIMQANRAKLAITHEVPSR